MKLFGRIAPNIEEVRADTLKVGQRLAGGRFQEFDMSNVAHAGEEIMGVNPGDDGLIYVVGETAPQYAWTLEPGDIVMIEKEA